MQCVNCGAVFEPEHAKRAESGHWECRYCGAALPVTAKPPQTAPSAFAGFGDLLADRDGDGMPDIVQQAITGGAVHSHVSSHVVSMSSQHTVVRVVHPDGRVETKEYRGEAGTHPTPQGGAFPDFGELLRHTAQSPGASSFEVGINRPNSTERAEPRARSHAILWLLLGLVLLLTVILIVKL